MMMAITLVPKIAHDYNHNMARHNREAKNPVGIAMLSPMTGKSRLVRQLNTTYTHLAYTRL